MNKKYALILGASGDIGSSIARKLASSGWSLYLHYNSNSEKTNKLIDELITNYSQQEFMSVKCDLVEDEITEITDNLFSLDAIIFAQGITKYGLFNQLTDDEFQTMLQVNYVKPLQLVKQLESKLAHSEFARIVFIGSIYGKTGSAMEVVYSSLKGALSAFANAYAKEVASLGITVNVLAPGAVNTAMIADFTSEELANVKEQIPVGRLAQPEDISFWVDTLLNKNSVYMTGETIYVTGGWLR